MERLGFRPQGQAVLEVGAFDGYLLSRFDADTKVGIDLEPAPAGLQHAPVVAGSGRRPPFRDASFDTVFLMDVAEHEEKDRELLCSVAKLPRPGGFLYMSVPSKGFTAFPPFITNALHRNWGHVRSGYTPDELLALLPPCMQPTVIEWNEPFFRLLYLPGRVLWWAFPPAGRLLMRLCAWLDGRFPSGLSGHLFLRLVLRQGP